VKERETREKGEGRRVEGGGRIKKAGAISVVSVVPEERPHTADEAAQRTIQAEQAGRKVADVAVIRTKAGRAPGREGLGGGGGNDSRDRNNGEGIGICGRLVMGVGEICTSTHGMIHRGGRGARQHPGDKVHDSCQCRLARRASFAIKSEAACQRVWCCAAEWPAGQVVLTCRPPARLDRQMGS
jgi:hypothetical protein